MRMLGRDVLVYLLSAAQPKPAAEPSRPLPAPAPEPEEKEESEDSEGQTVLESQVGLLTFSSDEDSKDSGLLTSSEEEF